jgi:hypothetical protein
MIATFWTDTPCKEVLLLLRLVWATYFKDMNSSDGH